MNLKEERAKYVYERVQEYRNRPKAFIDLGQELFLHPKTIYKDWCKAHQKRRT